MKRLIDTKKPLSFKNWIRQHNPKEKWDFNDPLRLKEQFIDTIQASGDLDLKTIYEIMFAQEDSGLTPNQHKRFDLDKNY